MTQSRQHSDPVRSEYARLAPEYDKRWSFYLEATTRETLARFTVGPVERILDVGCGTGALLSRLYQICPQAELVGVDPVPEMLAVARGKLSSSVELREAYAEQLPFKEESFDAIVSCNMFHYIRHPSAALKEMARVLRRGGRLVLTDWCDDYLTCRLCDWYLRLVNPVHFKVYGTRECRLLLEGAGFAHLEIERYKINWLWGLMTALTTKHGKADPFRPLPNCRQGQDSPDPSTGI